VASSEALRDHTLRSRWDRSLLSARNLDCLTIAAQCEFSVLVHGFLSLSFRAKSRNLSIHLDSGSSCRRPEKVLNYYATNEKNDEWLCHVQALKLGEISRLRCAPLGMPSRENDDVSSSFVIRISSFNTHPAYTAYHSSAFQRIHSLARRFSRPALARFCAAFHRHPWPSGVHRRT